jgi:hypothetical protein
MIDYLLIVYLVETLMWYVDTVLTRKLHENRLQYIIYLDKIKKRVDKPIHFQRHEYFMGIYDTPEEIDRNGCKKLKVAFENIESDNIFIIVFMPAILPVLLLLIGVALINIITTGKSNDFKIIFGGIWEIYSGKIKEIKIIKEDIFLIKEELKEKKKVKEGLYGVIYETFVKEVV